MLSRFQGSNSGSTLIDQKERAGRISLAQAFSASVLETKTSEYVVKSITSWRSIRSVRSLEFDVLNPRI